MALEYKTTKSKITNSKPTKSVMNTICLRLRGKYLAPRVVWWSFYFCFTYCRMKYCSAEVPLPHIREECVQNFATICRSAINPTKFLPIPTKRPSFQELLFLACWTFHHEIKVKWALNCTHSLSSFVPT